MAEIIQKIRARLQEIRENLKSRRSEIIDEAKEMLLAGFDEDMVFEELRDRYVDSVPLFAEKLDGAVDFEKILPGIAGQILEAVDGLLIDRLLHLFVKAATRRVEIDGPTIGDFRKQLADKGRRRVEIVRRPIASSVADVPSRPSALDVSSGGGGWGMDEEI